jgi:hypothetical protein
MIDFELEVDLERDGVIEIERIENGIAEIEKIVIEKKGRIEREKPKGINENVRQR